MKQFFLLFLSLQYFSICLSQTKNTFTLPPFSKPPIDSAAIMNWYSLGYQVAISDNGKYFMYSINNQPAGSQTIVLQSTENNWRKQLINTNNGFFSPGNKQFIFQLEDTLCFLKLGTNDIYKVTGVRSYKQSSAGRKKWLAYLLKNDQKELIVKNLLTDKEVHLFNATDYMFVKENALLLHTSLKKGDSSIPILNWINLPHLTSNIIWENSSTQRTTITGIQFDAAGRQMLFMTADTTLWYYQAGKKQAVMKLNNKMPTVPTGFCISPVTPAFSNNGLYASFYLQPLLLETRKPSPDAVQVDIWNYKNAQLPIEQHSTDPTSHLATLSLETDTVRKVGEDNETIININITNYILIKDGANIPSSNYWWPSYNKQSYWLYSLKNGNRQYLAAIYDWANITFSPNGEYIMYYDLIKQHYYSRNLSTGITKNISGDISGSWFHIPSLSYPFSTIPQPIFEPVAWLQDDNVVLVYDEYDIWQLDLTGQKSPIILTNGREKQIKFRIMDSNTSFRSNSTILLTAFDMKNKHNGFYRVTLNRKHSLERLSMGPWSQYLGYPAVVNLDLLSLTMLPLKAANSEAWITKRETASQAPNYYYTKDFKTYKALTDLQPQQVYNWLTTELITWQQLDSTYSQGILYKPENFDPNKKYPIIFEYYEELSQNMYVYPLPDFSKDRINIPWYVSRGYLVFTPDIHYDVASVTGKVNGDYVINSIVSAAQYLARLPYVDANKMGLQGHSFGGGETLYLITHSNLFTAACAAAPTVSNEITAYLGVGRAHGKLANAKMMNSESGHNKIGATLWQRPDLYIKASPVFRADKVTTPLLLMHNLGDGICDFNQSAEMFMALRRLGKKVWLLQYDYGDHGVDGKDAIDYTMRMQQFFDHYLKGTPAPQWMTRGIPANLKGIETGLELEMDAKLQP